MLSKLNSVTADIPTRQDIKDMHLKEIYLKVLRSGGISRAQLKGEMKLSFPSISALVDELIEKELLFESESVKSPSLGRPRILLRVNPKSFFIPVVRLMREGYRFTLFDSAANKVESTFLPFDSVPITPVNQSWKPTADVLCAPFEKWISEIRKKYKLSNLVLCVAGRLCGDGSVHSSDLQITTPGDLLGTLSGISGTDVSFMNVTVCLTYAEKIYRSMCEDFTYIYIHGGVGTCTVRGGEIYGSKQLLGAGEIGHLSIDYNGRSCVCGGKGCLERYVSQNAICADAAEVLGIAPEDINFERVCREYREGNPKIIDMINPKAKQLAVGITNALSLHPVKYVVLGGGIEKLGDEFLERVCEFVKNGALSEYFSDVTISYTENLSNDDAIGGLWNYLDNEFKLSHIL